MIIIKITKCFLALLEDEMLTLLKSNPAIWGVAIKRGKGYSRTEKSLARVGKANKKELK